MHMLFPFKSVCASFVDLRPVGVISLERARRRQPWTKRTRHKERRDVLLCNVIENHIYRREEDSDDEFEREVIEIEGLTDEVIKPEQSPGELVVIFHNYPYARTDAPIYEFCPPSLCQAS